MLNLVILISMRRLKLKANYYIIRLIKFLDSSVPFYSTISNIMAMEMPKFSHLSSNSIGTIGSTSVDDIPAVGDIETKKSKKTLTRNQKITYTSVFILFCLIAVGIIFYIYKYEDVLNELKIGHNTNLITADMVLPNTTLEIDTISNSKSKGEISYYTGLYSPHELKFNFLSIYNETTDLVSFICDDVETAHEVLDEDYNKALNGICGFEICWIGRDSNGENPHFNGTEAHSSYLEIKVYNIDQSIDSIIFHHSSGNNSEVMSDADEELFNSLVLGKIGEYFVELSIKLGSYVYIGNKYKSLGYIVSFARYFYSICDKNEANCKWDNDILDEAVSLTNQIISTNQNTTKNETVNNGNKTIQVSPPDSKQDQDGDRRRMQV